MAIYGTIQPNENDTDYDPFGRQMSGNPLMDQFLHQTIGFNYRPKPKTGQDQYDAFMTRERSKQMLLAQRGAWGNNMMFQSMGLPGGMAETFGQLMGSPDGLANSLMSPLIGGNPVATQMGALAKLQGGLTMGAFGRSTGINVAQSNALMRSFQYGNNGEAGGPIATGFYKMQGEDDFYKEKNAEMQRRLSASPELARQLGFGEGGKPISSYDLKSRAAGVRGEVTARQGMANELDSLGRDLADNESKSGNSDYKKETSELVNKRIKAILAGVKGGAEEALKKENIDSKTGMLTSEFIAKTSGQLRDLNADESLAFAASQPGKRIKGINFANTRGLTLDQFGSAFGAAADMRMMGGQRSVQQTGADFIDNAGGALSAGKALFGDVSGGELVHKINNIVGSIGTDLTSKGGKATGGANDAEAMLRKVKSTAKVAGASIDVLFGIIESAQEVARNNPKLQHIQNITSTEMALKAVSTASTVGQVLGNADVRQAGGQQQMAIRDISESQAFASSELGGRIAVLHNKFRNTASFDEATKIINEETAKGITPASLERMKRRLAGLGEKGLDMAGLSQSDLGDPLAQAEALSHDDTHRVVNAAHEASVNKSYWSHAGQTSHMRGGEIATQEVASRMYDEALALDKKRTDAGLASHPVTMRDILMQLNPDAGSHRWMQDQGGSILTSMARYRNKEAFVLADKMVADQTLMRTKMDKDYAKFNAPEVTQLIDTLASGGKMDEKKIETILSTFLAPDGAKESDREAGQKNYDKFKALHAVVGDKTKSETQRISDVTAEKELNEQERGALSKDRSRFMGSYDEATAEYNDLQAREKNKEKLTDTEKEHLETYRSYDKLGIMGSARAYQVGSKGTAASLLAGREEAVRDEARAQRKKEEYAGVTSKMDEGFGSLITSGGEEAAMDAQLQKYYTKDGKVDYQKMANDRDAGTGAFDAKTGIAKADDFDVNNRGKFSKSGALLTSSLAEYNTADDRSAATPGGGSTVSSPLQGILEQLNKTLLGFGGPLGELGKVLNKII